MKLFRKGLSLVLAVVMLVSIIPISSIANSDKKETLKVDTSAVETDASELKINGEVVSLRNEFTKVYGLEDGTFLEITSSSPLHEKRGGEWQEINDIAQPETVSDVKQVLNVQSQTQTRSGNNRSQSDIPAENYVSTWFYNYDTGYTPNSSTIDTENLFLAKVYSSTGDSDFVTISAEMSLNLSVAANTEDYLLMFENPNTIQDCSTATFADFYFLENNNVHLLDMDYVDSTGTYTFDLTDAYNRWSKGYSEDNGVVFNTADLSATVTNIVLQRRYRMVTPFDATSTYHSVDMGRAGTVYIDDFTNHVYLKTSEISVASNTAPIQVQRLINYSYPSNSSTGYYGYAAQVNYEARIERIYTDNSQNAVYLWHAVNGEFVYFVVNATNLTTVADSENQGYVLSATNNTFVTGTDFSNMELTTPDNSVVTFRADGRMTNLVDQYGDEIYIKYMSNSNNIDYIQDGLNRRYVFEYVSGTSLLNDITVKYRQGVMYRQLTVDGVDVKYTYTYTNVGDRYGLLSSITLPNGESVSYGYDANGNLSTVTNVDGRRLTLNYSHNVPEYSMTSNNVAYTITRTTNSLNRAPAVSGYVEAVPNVDDDPNSQNFQAYLTLSSLSIDSHNSYQRKFTDNKGNEEIIKYDYDLRPVFYKDSQGNYYSYHYAQNSQNDTITKINPDALAVNAIQNPDFETNTASWNIENQSNIGRRKVNHPDFTNNYMLRFNGSCSTDLVAKQVINASGISQNAVLALSAKGIANAAVNNESNFFGLEVYACADSSGSNPQLLYQLPFDSTVYYEQQEVAGAFTLANTTPYLMVKLVFSKQSGIALFDDITLAVASDGVTVSEVGELPQEESIFDARDTVTYNGKGLVNKISRTNTATNQTKETTFSYDNKYLLNEYHNNSIQTNYVYDWKSGVITGKAGIYGSTTFESSPIFLLKKVSTAVSNLSSGSSIDTSYTYAGDRVKTITNNSQTYSFEYNSYGKIKEIKLKGTEEATASSLVEYDYRGSSEKLNSIVFENGDYIEYSYNAAGNIDEICAENNFNSNNDDFRYFYYDYYYDGNNNLTGVYDEINEWNIEYSNNAYTITDADDEVIYSDVFNANTQEHEYSVFGMDYTQSESRSTDAYNNQLTTTSIGLAFTSADDEDYEESVTGTSTVDYFDRKTGCSFSSVSSENPFLDGEETITYSVNTAYNSTVNNEFDTVNNSITSVSNAMTEIDRYFQSSYEYDSDGRITKVYYAVADDDLDLDDNLALAYYYEYDEAGQVTMCVNLLANEVYTYSYDSSGNLAEKSLYCENDFTFNTSTCACTLSTPHSTQQYGYNTKGLLSSYNGHTLTSNANGNLVDYYDGNTHYRLVWLGNRLMSAYEMNGDTERYRYDYAYDDNGMLTKKTKTEFVSSYDYSGPEPVVTVSEQAAGKTEYIWNDGKMSGYRYWFKESGNWYSVIGKYIYDGEEAIGVITHSDVYSSNLIDFNDIFDNTEILTNNIFWFIKDAQGNTVSIYSPRNDFSLDISRNENGFPGFSSTGYMLECMEEYCHRQSGRWAGLATALAIALATEDTKRMTQSDFKGYLYDYETNICYADGRYYSLSLGRYLNIGDLRDLTNDIGNSAITNPFAFCRNDTINNYIEQGTTTKQFVETQLDANYVTNWYKYFKQH